MLKLIILNFNDKYIIIEITLIDINYNNDIILLALYLI